MANQPKKYQKFVATAATATLVASAIVPVASAAEKNFTDIEKYAQETQDAIYSLVDRGVITGKSDSIFAPAESITRGQVVKMLGRYLVNEGVAEVPSDWASKARFTDLPVDYKDQDLVKNAAVVADNNVFKGSNGKLNASNNISRENMALVLDRAIAALNGKSLVQLAKEEGLKGNVKDLNAAKAEARDAILALNAFGISAVENFNPKNDVNRAQFALFLERTIEAVLSDTTAELVEKAVVAGNALPKPEDVTKDNAADAQTKVDLAQKALDKAQKALDADKEISSEEKLELQAKLDKVKEQIKDVQKAIDATSETAGITSVKALNDTLVEVKFGVAIDKDFIREAELNGKYFAIYTEGNSLESALQSDRISFSADGKSAEFDLEGDYKVQSGKKYNVVLLNGDSTVASEVVHAYGPAVLKEATSTPGLDVSATADKIFVKYNTKMKDSAKEVKNYTVYDEGGQKLGKLSEFLADEVEEGTWTDLNDKKEVEFKLSTKSEQKFSAGKKYKLEVSKEVKTDDNKTLAEDKRTITVKTPSVDEASPVAKVARITGTKQVTIYFDKDISGKDVKINPAQLDLRTSTGKTVTLDGVDVETIEEDSNKLVLNLDAKVDLDEGTSYKIDMPANIVKNGVFPNAMNKATSGLKAEAQENKSINAMKAQIVANAKKNSQADLILTFDQVPVIDSTLKDNIQFFDGRKEYKLGSENVIKVFGGDTTGKSIIIEDVEKFVRVNAADSNDNGKKLSIRGDKSYDVEIEKGLITTDSFAKEDAKATNKNDLKASTKGISVAAPKVDEMRLESAEKIVIDFKEDIKGDIAASDITVQAFVADRSDIFNGSESKAVSGSGYYDVKISGKSLTITAKDGVKFVTGIEGNSEIVKIDKDAVTNTTGKTGNDPIVLGAGNSEDDIVDNAAPVIVGVEVLDLSGNKTDKSSRVKVTYSESVNLEGNNDDIAKLFFTDKGENATEAETYYNGQITFKEFFAKDSTDLSKVTLKYTAGNTYYIEDAENNKMKTQTIKGFYNDNQSSTTTPPSDKEANKTALTNAIADAKTAKDALTDEAKKAELQKAIEAAQAVKDDKKATQAQVDAAKEALEAAVKKAQETGDTVKASEIDFKVVEELDGTTTVSKRANELDAKFADKDLVIVFEGKEYKLTPNSMNKNILAASLPKVVDKATVDALEVKVLAK